MAYRFIPCPACGKPARSISVNTQRILYRCPVCLHVENIPNPVFNDPFYYSNSFTVLNHQGKADRFIHALKRRCTHYERTKGAVKFILSDSDVLGRARQMERLFTQGTKRFFVYPHSARPSMINDRWGTWDGTTAQIVVNEYHEEVLRTYGYTKPIIHSGWYLSPVNEFVPRVVENKINILFAPIHPRNAPQDQAANLAVFQKLLPLVRRDDIDLTIRYIGLLEDSNVPQVQGVKYTRGEMNGSTEQIEKADVVIAHQTFAWLAVAMGVPTLMFAEDMPTHFRNRGVGWTDTPSWDKVVHLFRYPLDLLTTDNPLAMIEKAMQSDDNISDWRRRMIGEPMQDDKFLAEMERYL